MFKNAEPPVVCESADPQYHPSLLQLTAEFPDGWVLFKAIPEEYVVLWACREMDEGSEEFRSNVVVQSVPMIDGEAVERATDLMVTHFAESTDWEVIADSVAPVSNRCVTFRSLSLRARVDEFIVLQNVFMLGVTDERPALIIITPSVEEATQEEERAAVRLLCSEIVSGVLSHVE